MLEQQSNELGTGIARSTDHSNLKRHIWLLFCNLCALIRIKRLRL